MTTVYLDRAQQPITSERWLELVRGDSYRVVARDAVGRLLVLTQWVGVAEDGDPSCLFQTTVAVQGTSDTGFYTRARYATEEEARTGHRAAVDEYLLIRDAMALEVETNRRLGPKTVDHPTVGERCPACGLPFVAGDYTMLIPLGPGADPQARERARRGAAYTGVATEVHYACATGHEELP